MEALLQTLVCVSACSGLQMCLHLCDGYFFIISENFIAIDVPMIKLLFVGVVLVSNTLSLLFNQRPSSRQMMFWVGE